MTVVGRINKGLITEAQEEVRICVTYGCDDARMVEDCLRSLLVSSTVGL